MKLIDILVEELPKNGGWPKGAAFVAQEEGGGLWSFTSMPQKDCDDEWMDESSRGYHKKVGKLPEASDHDTSSITREQYEAALAAKNEGWIEWGGGECPVISSEIVDVIFGHGGRLSSITSDCFRWNHNGTDSDIIAYRPRQPQQEWQPEASEEDLNDCIGQAPVTTWNGDGLPPVGCECEYQDSYTNEWYPVTIQYVSDQLIVICGVTNILGGEQKTEIAKDITCDKPRFRPIRSEDERRREEALKAMTLTGWHLSAAEEMYNLIASGKIPGIRLDD